MVSDILVVQSWFGAKLSWIECCLASVEGWAGAAGACYLRLDDALFDPLPGWAHDAARGARLALTDYARLLWLRRLLGAAERVIWLDADVLVFDPAGLVFPDAPFALARERWIWREAGTVRAEERVSNAAMLFSRAGGLLDWYVAACETILRDAPRPLNRTALGPQLLTALQAQRPVPLIDSIATLSPAVMADLLAGGGEALADHQAHWPARVAAAHLCRSLGGTTDAPHLVDESVQRAVVERLLTGGPALLGACAR
ncbi:MAG: hypothetical protein EOP70_17305 [Variovorax sp.]|nr:MAG: hypothetical protein EOP70_17305 [Variovorax sp.]